VCRIRVLLIGYPELGVYIVSWTWTFEVVVPMSRKHQPARAIWIFHRVVPSLVLKTMGVLCRVHRAFEAFDGLDQDLARFVELRIFPRCDQFLVPWPCGIEPKLA
jgi:hypothetical protein